MVARFIGLVSVSLLTAVIFSEGWILLLSAGGTAILYRQAFAILGIAQIGKYLPGNVFHIVGRATMGFRQGIPSATLAVTIWIEAVLILVAAALLVVAGVVSDTEARSWLITINPISSLRLFLLVGGISILLFVGCLLLAKRLECLKDHKNLIKPAVIFKVVMLYLLIFVLYGCMIKLTPLTIWGKGLSMPLSQAIWRFALCWVAGFVVPGAPAGLGVREALFIRLFAPGIGEGVAACVAVAYRIITTLGDLLTFLVAYWVGRSIISKS